MGNKDSLPKLPKDLKRKVGQVFSEFDHDQSGCIDKEETMKRWNTIFARHNTEEMFKAVDEDCDGTITLKEWEVFWRIQLKEGKSKEEIFDEIEALSARGSWTSSN